MTPNRSLLFAAWTKLIRAYVFSLVIGLVVGMLLVKFAHIEPERLYDLSTRRLSYALPVFEAGSNHGIDMGILLFAWNSVAALSTLSFFYTVAWFDPDHIEMPPRRVRRIFCGTSQMKLFCYLPGCAKIETEPVRRAYVWAMVPLLGIILLGLESGLQVSTTTQIFGSFYSAFITLLPHGLIEIPSLALAGAVTYSANLLIRDSAMNPRPHPIFQQLETYRTKIPIKTIACLVIGALLLAGLIEAHVTPLMMQGLRP